LNILIKKLDIVVRLCTPRYRVS